ncbi:hypothetical protein WG68_05460 [Arsukibacterium ikkense]|uniref:Solute-binding protein family 3/N-terminal domain-containing protein n=1 Tax=Arsukibacterium ikkense TaxID=336831 RepID=A0A0M2V6G7_9GAMM|nr:transporter substrate-binding domain-containing protein [Arsukibacterium ikkense]KKO46221.1 hypothetical protein WG68_05460 [Arsukibacterium ikkense]
MKQPAAILISALCSLWLTAPLAAGMPDPVPLSTAAEPLQLTWCLDHFPYFHEYDNSATPTGPSVELMQELAHRAGFILNFTPRTPLARCLKLMEQGKVDLMSNLKFSEQRDQFMYMLPYRTNVAESLFMRVNDQRLIDSNTQLRGLTLATLRHYLYNPATMTLIAEQSRHIAEVDSIEVALEMLLRNRVDGVVAPTVSTAKAINAISSYQQRFKIAPLDFSANTPNNIHLALARNSRHAALEPLLRQHLQAMIADGTIARLIRPSENRPEVNQLKQ